MKTYTSEDGTLYQEYTVGYTESVKVIKTELSGVAEAYNKINKYLADQYQPLQFTLSDGVYISSDSIFGYVKQIEEDDNGYIKLSVFGSDDIITLADQSITIMPSDSTILEPLLSEDADQTYHFSNKSHMTISEHEIVSYCINNQNILKIDNKRITGQLVNYTDDYLSLCDRGKYWLYNLKQSKLNYLLSNLPGSVNCFIQDNKLYLAGIKLSRKPQTFLISEVTAESNNFIEFVVSTYENPQLFFRIAFSISSYGAYTLILNDRVLGDVSNFMEV